MSAWSTSGEGPLSDLKMAAFFCPHMEKKERRGRERVCTLVFLSLSYKLQHVNFQSIIPVFLDFVLTISQNHCPLSDIKNMFLIFCSVFIVVH